MYLTSLEIKNYRSLEDIRLEHISRFNVLIGRNNAGKSSVFNVLLLLSKMLRGEGVAWERAVTAREFSRSLEIRLVFQPRSRDREEFVDLLIAAGHPADRRETLIKGALLRQLEFFFKSSPDAPGLLHLQETKLWAEDNAWAVVQRLIGDTNSGSPETRFTYLGETGRRGELTGASLILQRRVALTC